MGKVTKIASCHIVVEPHVWSSTPDAAQRACRELMANIKRHCDDIDNIHIETKYESTCEHCGYNWGEESKTYNGGCCEKDEENSPENTEQRRQDNSQFGVGA